MIVSKELSDDWGWVVVNIPLREAVVLPIFRKVVVYLFKKQYNLAILDNCCPASNILILGKNIDKIEE